MNQNKSVVLLFNPSVYIAGAQALGLGITAILLAGLIGAGAHAHFDGVLDTHIGAAAPLWAFLLEGFIDWLCLGVVLLVLGKIISRTSFRAIDLLGTQALARWPTFIISLVLLPKAFTRFANDLLQQILRGGTPHFNAFDAVVFGMVIIALLILVCWMVELMYKSFSTSCNVKGGKAIGTFIGGLLLAELVSKTFVVLMVTHAVASTGTAGATATPAGPLPALEQTATQFVGLLEKEDFATAEISFDPTMKSALPEAKLREVWQTLLADAGAFKQTVRSRTQKVQGYDVVFVTCKFERKQLDMKVVYDFQGRVAGLFYVPTASP
jgi:hypothetical protein